MDDSSHMRFIFFNNPLNLTLGGPVHPPKTTHDATCKYSLPTNIRPQLHSATCREPITDTVHLLERAQILTDAPNLSGFYVRRCEKLSSLPEQIILHALKGLELRDLPQLVPFSARCLPSSLKTHIVDVGVLSCMSKDELGLLFQLPTSLSRLYLYKGFGEEEDLVNTLLKKQLLPTSLTNLYLWSFRGLKMLEGKGLQHLTSLQTLGIKNCGSLESLPEEQLPSSLEKLFIYWCPLLKERYESGKGKYRSKIAHIPTIIINDRKEEEVIIT